MFASLRALYLRKIPSTINSLCRYEAQILCRKPAQVHIPRNVISTQHFPVFKAVKGHGGHKGSKKEKKSPEKESEEECLMDPACKIAIVTGGATGIGYAAACQLLCSGAEHVVIGGKRCDEGQDAVHNLNCKFGADKAIFVQTDVTNEKSFENLFKETINSFGQVDILFNNAGILEDKEWALTVDTNIKGVLCGCFLAFEHMGKDHGGNGGVVVNNASILGFDAFPPAPVYCCSKHAVVGITKCFGADFHFCRTNIRVASLCPGVTTTDLITGAHGRQYNEDWSEETARSLGSMPAQEIDACGKAFVYVVRYGCSGHHYIIENSEVLHADIPDRHTFSILKCSFK